MQEKGKYDKLRKIKRPLLCGCLMLIAVIVLYQRLVDPPPWKPQLPGEWDGQLLTVTGQVYEKEVRTLYGQEVLILYLKSVTVSSDTESGDDESIPYISEQKIKDKLICRLSAEQAAWLNMSAGGLTGQKDIVSALEQQICLGSRIAVQGKLELYAHATNPGEWDSADYNLITGVAGQLKQAQLLGSDNGKWQIREWLYGCRIRLKGRLYQALPQKEASILAKMLLGEKYGLDQEVKELYQNNGIAHVLAISGLHITLLGMGLYRLLRRCGCPIVPAAIAGGCMILLYGCMVGWGISAVRAIGMYLIRMLGEIWSRQYDMLTAMGVLAAGMVCRNPRLVYHCGFLLSFGAVAGMGWLYPALQKSLSDGGIERAVRLRRAEGGRDSYALRGLTFLQGIIKSLLASLCITLATLPVQLYFFYQIPVYGTLLNLLVLPLVGILVAGGLVLMALPAILPVRWGIVGILSLYEGLCHIAEALPGHLWITGRPKWWQITGYYGLLIITVNLWKHRQQGKPESTEAFANRKCLSAKQISGTLKQRVASRAALSGGSLAAALTGRWGGWGCPLLLTMSVILLTGRFDNGFAMTMLDVGQGDCICVHTSQGQNYLFDAGSSSRSGVGEYVLIPYLKYQGIHTIDGIFVSHSDIDHVNAIRELLKDNQGIRIKVLYLPRLAEPLPELFEEFESLAREADCQIVYLSQGMGWQQGDFRLTCLWPKAGYAGESNAGSACYLLEEGKLRILFTGDVEGEGERALSACLEKMHISGLDVLKVAHHGSRYSTSETFLQSVLPQLALISAGRNNSYGHPHGETLQRLEKAGCTILQTPESGAIIIRYTYNKIGIEKYLTKLVLTYPIE